MCEKTQTNGDVISRVVRKQTYSLNLKTEDCIVGDIVFNAKNNYRDKEFLLLRAILEYDSFAKFYELAGRLVINEEKIGREVLKTKYKTAYHELFVEMNETFNEYLIAALNKRDVFSKVYLSNYFNSEEFNLLVKELQNTLKILIKERKFDDIPMTIENSKLSQSILEKDNECLLGNYQIPCEKIRKITNIKWCSANCKNFSTCSIWKEMEKNDKYNWHLNQEYLVS